MLGYSPPLLDAVTGLLKGRAGTLHGPETLGTFSVERGPESIQLIINAA